MAILAAFKLASEPEYAEIVASGRLKAVHCFAPPMVGNEDFAKRWSEFAALRGKLSTYVFSNDIVPHLPPVPGFVHFGRTFLSSEPGAHLDPSRFEWKESSDTVERAPITALGDAALHLVGELTTVKLFEHLGKVVRELMASLGLMGRRYSFYDHSPTNYVACSQPEGRPRTEFGNDF